MIEELVFQGIEFLRFPNKCTNTEIHEMVGNSFPPRMAACLYHAIQKVQSSRTDRPTNSKLNSGWVNKTSIDLFSGLGGMAMGLDYVDDWCSHIRDKMPNVPPCSPGTKVTKSPKYILKGLGFKHQLLVDMSVTCTDTLKNVDKNKKYYKWKENQVLNADANNVDYTKYYEKTGVLSGGPPCQPFSTCGQKKGLMDAREGWTICAKALLKTAAEVFVFENVAGISNGKSNAKSISTIKSMLSDPWSYFNKQKRRARTQEANKEKGVNIKHLDVNVGDNKDSDTTPYPYVWLMQHFAVRCSDFGVPQNRDRCIFVGFRIVRGTKVCLGDPLTRLLDYLQGYKMPDKRSALEVIQDNAINNDNLLMEGRMKLPKSSHDDLLWQKVDDQYAAMVT